MTPPEIIFALVVLLVGIPSMWRNVTAIALVVSWGLGQAVWMISGDNLPLRIYFLCDLTVLTAILCKSEAFNCLPYHGPRHQVRCLLLERSLWDRIVIMIFPAMWAVYVLPVGEYNRWWTLFYLALAQLLAAGGESFQSWRAANPPEAASDNPSSGMKFSVERGFGGYG
jgi:hypothetical protein